MLLAAASAGRSHAAGDSTPAAALATSAESLRFDPAPPSLDRAKVQTLVSRFVTEIAAAPPSEAIDMLDLLVGAPPAVVDGVVDRFREKPILSRVYETADDSARTRLLNSQALGSAKLREFFAIKYVSDLRVALSRGAAEELAYLAAAAAGFRRLDNSVGGALLDALDQPLPEQVRQEFEAAILERAANFAPHAKRLRDWAAAPVGNVDTERRRAVAQKVLLSLGSHEDDGLVDAALESDDAQRRAMALSYLAKAQDAAPESRHDGIVRAFLREKELPVWNATRELLQRRAPSAIDLVYSQITEDQASLWSAEIQASFILQAPPPHDRRLTTWTVPDVVATCGELWRSLAILEQRARAGQDVGADLTRVAAALNLVAPCSPPGDQGTFKSLPVAIARAIATARERASADAHALDTIDTLLELPVRPSATELGRAGYWTLAFAPSSTSRQLATDVRIVSVTREAPESAHRAVAILAASEQTDAVQRSNALVALAAINPLDRDATIYRQALADTNPIVSRAALILLGNGLTDGRSRASDLLPSLEVVQNIAIQPDLAEDARELFRRLVSHGEQYAAAYAEYETWDRGVGAACFALAAAGKVTTSMAVDLLNASATAESARGTTIRSCVLLLVGPEQPIATLARWTRMPAEPALIEQELSRLLELWRDSEFARAASGRLKDQVIFLVSAYAPEMQLGASTQHLLSDWERASRPEHAKEADELASEHRSRTGIMLLLSVPLAVVAHLLLWLVLLSIYPRSRTVQAVVFWNPRVRKLLGLGYIDVILLYVPFARRRLLLPFSTAFLGDIAATTEDQLDRVQYYEESSVHHAPVRGGVATTKRSIVSTLERHFGRILLLGKSGTGKSSFLRYALARRVADGRDTIVYLRADECRSGVEAEIERRMQGFGSDHKLLNSMIYAGRIWVFIDGYNEVDIKTQDIITGFLANYPYANVLVASQIPLRGLTTIETYELQPLDRDQIRDFLRSRAAVLSHAAPVRNDAFEASAAAFLDDIWSRSDDAAVSAAFDEILSNPMDLTSVALLLGDGRVPDVFALEAQQFESVRRVMSASGSSFRVNAFSAAVLEQRATDQENLAALPFTPEVVALVNSKLALVRTFADQAAVVALQEIRFRHDRIRDYFTHFAFMAMDVETRARKAQDARFAGVYPFLARALPGPDAEALREALIRLAAEIEDHRVSDTFVREYSWRQRFAGRDPEWMLGYDLPSAREAEAQYEELSSKRRQLDGEMSALRDHLAEARRVTRILTTADAVTLLDLAHEILVTLGAWDDPVPSSSGQALFTPAGLRITLLALGQPEDIRPFHVELLSSRLRGLRSRVIVVTNAHVGAEPETRPPDLDDGARAELARAGAIPVSAYELYRAHVQGARSVDAIELWRRIDEPPVASVSDDASGRGMG